jgi:hypothetical protein
VQLADELVAQGINDVFTVERRLSLRRAVPTQHEATRSRLQRLWGA